MTSQEKVDALGSQFSSAHVNPLANEHPDFTSEVADEVQRYLDTHHDLQNIEYPSVSDVKTLIRRLKTTKAPGIDRVHNTLVKQLPHYAVLYLHFIVCCCLKLSYFPAKWKHAKVIPIKKPGKNPVEITSYRPISLLSSISKILEKILVERINKHIVANDILPNEQHGFRAGLSTNHQLYRLKNHIHTKLRNGQSTGIVFCDVEKAFDRVWHDGLVLKMIRHRFPVYIVRIINNFIRNRTFEVNVSNKNSTTHCLPFGVPQGSCCSPILYNIYISDCPRLTDCDIAFYADDTAFFKSSSLRAEITIPLRNAVRDYINYFSLWKISLNVSKTVAAFFTNRRRREIPRRPLNIDGSAIQWTHEPVKYLGMLFDKRVTMRQHIQYVIDKTSKAVRILYPLLNRKSQLNKSNKILLYKVALRPILSYGGPILSTIAPTHIKKLQIMQNKILRMCLEKPRYTRINELHEEAGVETMSVFINKLNSKFITSPFFDFVN